MKCFYHKSDLDGHCSGAIIKEKYPDCKMIGVDYNDCLDNLELTFDTINKDEDIFVVDFRFSIEDMQWLSDNATLHWVDHHKTALDEAHEVGFISSGGQLLEIGKAGCELTWIYEHGETDMPLAVSLLGRYDVWDHEDKRTLPFQYGMRTHPNTLPDCQEVWNKVFNDYVYWMKIIETGEIILAYENSQNTMYAKGMSYEAEFEGLRAIVMNKAYANSKAFDSIYDDSKHDIMIMYGVKPGEIKYSLYSVKAEIDVSEIAKKYGGGGHKGAAGFYTKTLTI